MINFPLPTTQYKQIMMKLYHHKLPKFMTNGYKFKELQFLFQKCWITK